MARAGVDMPVPRWILVALVVQLPAWPIGMYWANNGYSGWNVIASAHPTDGAPLVNSQGPTAVTVVSPTGRKWAFDDYRTGMAHVYNTEVGFDDTGFWVRARGSGWFSGPRKPAFIPWRHVAACDTLRVQLRHPNYALIIHDQPLLDACRRQMLR